MAELTNVETKLGEVTGLAMAAQAATEKVAALAERDKETDLLAKLRQMQDEAAETERRCTDLAGTFEGKKTAILEEARSTKAKGAEMMKTYLDSESDSLDGFEFLTMAEAGEVGHWSVLAAMSQSSGAHPQVVQLVEWALPIQQRHLKDVMDASIGLAADEDPDELA
jgi:hypothetical protein